MKNDHTSFLGHRMKLKKPIIAGLVEKTVPVVRAGFPWGGGGGGGGRKNNEITQIEVDINEELERNRTEKEFI